MEEENQKTETELANEAAERLEKANAERLSILDREENLKAVEVVSGETEAGSTEEPEVELTDAEYRAQIEKDMEAGKYD